MTDERTCPHCINGEFVSGHLPGGSAIFSELPMVCPWCSGPTDDDLNRELAGLGTGDTDAALDLLSDILSSADSDGRLDHDAVVGAVAAHPLGAAVLIMNWMADRRGLTEVGYSIPGRLTAAGRSLRFGLRTKRHQ